MRRQGAYREMTAPISRIELLIGEAIVSRVDGQWFFPIGRRLLSPTGNFAGTIAARGRIDYFQQFYQDVQLDKATKVTPKETRSAG